MEFWITRQADRGILLLEYASPDEIEESLKGLERYDEFSLKEEVKVEITAPWEEVKQFFQDLQHLADLVRTLDFDRDSEPDKLIRRLEYQKIIKVT